MKILNERQGTDEWLEARKERYGASEVANLFNANPFAKLKDQKKWLAGLKLGIYEVKTNAAMQRGNRAEPRIRERAEQMFGEMFSPLSGAWDEWEKITASFDGITADGDSILEIKKSHHTFKFVKNNDEPPNNYYLQCQQQLLVSGAKRCYFVVEGETEEDLAYCIVHPDKRVQKEIVKRWREFDEYLNKAKAEHFAPSAELEAAAEAYRDALDAFELAKKELEVAKKRLVDAADGEKQSVAGVTVYPIYYTDYERAIEEAGIDTALYVVEKVDYRAAAKDAEIDLEKYQTIKSWGVKVK